MRFLLDEHFDPVVADALTALTALDGDSYLQIAQEVGPGTADPDIPPLCKELGIDALITANFKDFGARKFYYEALLEAGVNVVVVRPGKVKFFPNEQLAILSRAQRRVRVLLIGADGPTLIRVTQSDVRERTLDELIKEFEEGQSLP